jgi:hypothetical protein
MRITSTTATLILMVSIIPLASITATTTIYAQVPTQTTATVPEVKAIIDAIRCYSSSLHSRMR